MGRWAWGAQRQTGSRPPAAGSEATAAAGRFMARQLTRAGGAGGDCAVQPHCRRLQRVLRQHCCREAYDAAEAGAVLHHSLLEILQVERRGGGARWRQVAGGKMNSSRGGRGQQRHPLAAASCGDAAACAAMLLSIEMVLQEGTAARVQNAHSTHHKGVKVWRHLIFFCGHVGPPLLQLLSSHVH